MQLTDCHPVIVDVFKREAIYACLRSIGIPEADQPRWVIARRLIEPVLVADGEEAARHILEDYYLPAEVLDLEIPEITDIREVELHGAKHIACTILGQHYTAYLPPEAEQPFEDWGHAANH